MCGAKDIETGCKISEAFYNEWNGVESGMKLGDEFCCVC